MRVKPDAKYKLNLTDRFCEMMNGHGGFPMLVHDIMQGPEITTIWREFHHDMSLLMHHIVGATRLITEFRDGHTSSDDT